MTVELVVNTANWRGSVFDWREKERQRIIENLETMLAEKIFEIDKKISNDFFKLTTLNKLRVGLGFQEAAKKFHDKNVAPVVNDWLNRTYEKLCQNIPVKQESGSIKSFHGPNRFTQNWNAILQTSTGALLGIGAVSALPAGVSAAVTTTTTLFIFSTTVISLPVLAAAAGGAAVAGALGIKKFEKGFSNEELTAEYRKEVVGALREKVLGAEYLYMAPVEEGKTKLALNQMSLAQILLLEVDHIAFQQLEEFPWPRP